MKKEIKINGVTYPLRGTMGALVRFKQNMGYEVANMDPTDTEANCAFFYYCIVAACNADGVQFPFDFLTFCDILTQPLIAEMSAVLNSEKNEEKKTANN